MRAWTALGVIVKESFFSRELAKAADKLNEAIEQLLSKREALDRRWDEMLARSPVDVDPGDLGTEFLAVEGNRFERIQLLGIELRLRRDLTAFHENRRAEHIAAAGRARELTEQTRAEICTELEGTGYAPWTGSGQTDPTGIIPMFWMRHPRFRQAIVEADAIESGSRDHSALDANQVAIEKAGEEIRLIRERFADVI